MIKELLLQAGKAGMAQGDKEGPREEGEVTRDDVQEKLPGLGRPDLT